MSTSPLFLKYIDNFTIGELPKMEKPGVRVNTTPERMADLGYVLVQGEWVYHTECVRELRNGKFTWVRMG